MSVVDPSLGRIPRVLVPVQVDALVLREARAGFADCAVAPPDPAGGRQDLAPPPFADRTAPRPAGVHLHWALPDALTRTRPTTPPGADGTAPVADLPPVPDRWLVVRLALGTTPDRRRWRAWALESSGAVPVVTELAAWHESGVGPAPGREPTALGTGDLAWAAYYDNVVGRLGFHDPLDDGAVGPLGYLVCGWYAEPRNDPLVEPAVTSLSAFWARLAELGWSLSGDELEQDVLALAASGPAGVSGRGPLVTDGSWWPQGCLMHGSVVGVGWPDVGWVGAEQGLLGTDQGGPPDPAQTRVALGVTGSDALGALMVGFLAAAQGVAENDVVTEDRLLEAFQLGLLSEVDHPDGRIRLDARLHAEGFRALGGGRQDAGVRAAGDDRADPGGTVQRSQPRWFAPGEPTVVVQGLRRSLKHGGDGRFSQDGTLVCRLSSFTVSALSTQIGDGAQRATVAAEQLLENPFGHPDLPPDCADLVEETLLLDPGSARAAALLTLPPLAGDPTPGGPTPGGTGPGGTGPTDTTTVDELALRFMVEQTVWWALRDPLVNAGALLARSGIAGSLPSPLAVTPPSAAWAPRHLDWAVEVFPSPRGLSEWDLGDLDLSHHDPATADTAPGHGTVVSGRSLLTGGIALRAARAGQAAIELATLGGAAGLGTDSSDVFVPALAGGLPTRLAVPATTATTGADADASVGTGTRTVAQAFVAALRDMDVAAATLTGVHARLRGEPTGQWVGSDRPPAPTPDPAAPGVVAGFLRPVRLRLVDAFGQVVDLLGSGPGRPAGDALTSRPVTVAGRPGLVALPPRFAAPARLLLRFTDARPGPTPPPLDTTDESARPVCGYLLPDHLDGALELFDADGTALGQLLPALDGSGRAVWEQAPGRPTGAGDLPSATIPDPTLGAIADGLVRWGPHDAAAGPSAAEGEGEGALAALLRLIDSTLWSTDPFGHTGDEHLALLVGHPVAVLRATLRLDVDDPLGPADVPTSPVTVRLGALAQWQDGLLAFYAGDDLAQVHPAGSAAARLARPVGPAQGYLGPAGQVAAFHASFADDLRPGRDPASPVTHPYVADDATVTVWPGHELSLAVLVVPHAVVHATSGLLPRKDLGVRRQWVADGLSRLAPTFRFGPVLVDPRTVRMPVATELGGRWSWSHRTDVSAWTDQPVVNATGDALMSTDLVTAEEGWLRLDLPQEPPS